MRRKNWSFERFAHKDKGGSNNSAQVYRIAIVQLEAIPVDQSSLGVVDAYFNTLGEKLYGA